MKRAHSALILAINSFIKSFDVCCLVVGNFLVMVIPSIAAGGRIPTAMLIVSVDLQVYPDIAVRNVF